MFARLWLWSSVLGCALGVSDSRSANAQPPVSTLSPSKEAELPPPPAANLVAATVNGQSIAEMAVFRGLLREDPKNWPTVRKDVLNYLIDNLLVDQYLTQLKIPVYEAKTEKDHLIHLAVCGAPSGKIHVFSIPKKFQVKVLKLGFKPLVR